MNIRFVVIQTVLLSSIFGFALSAVAQVSPALKPVLEMKEGVEKLLVSSSDQVTIARSQDAKAPGVIVTIQPGKDEYPGVTLKPLTPWDLSKWGHVEARVTNLGSKPIPLSLRVDGVGPWQDNPWNGNSATIEPGKTETAKTIFGYSWGKPGYAIKPNAISQILLFAGKSDGVQSFRIELLQAAGPTGETPPVAPLDSAAKRIKPHNGILFGAGTQVTQTQVTAQNARVSMEKTETNTNGNINTQGTMHITLPATTNDSSATFKPAEGRFDLRDWLQVGVKVRNDGQVPITPRVRIESDGGSSDWATGAPMAPGAQGEIVVPFASAEVKDLGRKETLGRFSNDSVSAITIGAEEDDAQRSLVVQSITAMMPPAPALPDWLGKRPPVEGDWVKTLDDEFNVNTLDTSLWSVAGENYWDKTSHWSRDNVLLGDGTIKLRYQKKTGFNNDDPAQKKSDYASGYLHTYDKWAQRYGYFESRMKLPKASGLWPAFWMMPDRGAAVGEQWKRQDTANGGMEFDILEHLTRWGGNRYNIAMHYDGYDKDHKMIGSDTIYAQPDKDGFITAGLLWTPGLAVYYANGKEVLRWENPRISNVPEMLMFTLPMGGWDNSPLDDALLPDDYTIDYVRVWQRRDLASPIDGKKTILAPVAK